jgi:uncharacterized protein (DUF2141 family)
LQRGKRPGAALLIAVLMVPVAVRAEEPPVPGALTVHFAGLRSAKGMIRACLTRSHALFLHCEQDPHALKASIPASDHARLDFADVPPGDYVLAVIHDENGNDKIDTFMGIPREGVGFSRNPAMHFGPPKYDAARFHVPSGPSETAVTFKYFL